jgi:hypothetical protein
MSTAASAATTNATRGSSTGSVFSTISMPTLSRRVAGDAELMSVVLLHAAVVTSSSAAWKRTVDRIVVKWRTVISETGEKTTFVRTEQQGIRQNGIL